MLYHKIQSVFKRDPDTNYRTFLPEYTCEEFELLKNVTWEGTEKIDGTNFRIMWDGEKVTFGGRTERAQLPADLLAYAHNTFTEARCREAFDGPVTLFGEGCGPGIQKHGHIYGDGKRVILFDAHAGCWLKREVLHEFSEIFDVDVAPVVFEGTLTEAVDLFANNPFASKFNGFYLSEGLVLRPAVELNDRMGRRVITKLKHKDFRNG